MAIRLVDVELSEPVQPVADMAGYSELRLLVKLHNVPLGIVRIAALFSYFEPEFIIEEIVKNLGLPILTHLLEDSMLAQVGYGYGEGPDSPAGSAASGLQQPELFDGLKNSLKNGLGFGKDNPPCLQFKRSKASLPVTVAVCFEEVSGQPAACLDALGQLDYPDYEVLVVENAPGSTSVRKLVEQYAGGKISYRYIIEPGSGLSQARNRAIREATGTIVAFIDPGGLADRGWLLSLVASLQRPGISLVTGLVYPLEVSCPLQEYAYYSSGLNSGFKGYEAWFPGAPKYDTYTYGGAVNGAAWRSVLLEEGGYSSSLDEYSPGKVILDGDLIYRLLSRSHTLIYDPGALVKFSFPHDARVIASLEHIRAKGIFTFLGQRFKAEPRNRRAIVLSGITALTRENTLRYQFRFMAGRATILRLTAAWLRGALAGALSYQGLNAPRK